MNRIAPASVAGLCLVLAGCATTDAAVSTPGVPSLDRANVVAATAVTPVTAVTAVTARSTPTAVAGATAAVGTRVAGVPAYLGLPPGATLTASAVQPAGALLQVSLSGTTTGSVKDVLAYYRATLTRSGFTATDDAVLPPGSTGTAYGRGGGQVLVVAVVDRGSVRSFSVGGTVSTVPAQKGS